MDDGELAISSNTLTIYAEITIYSYENVQDNCFEILGHCLLLRVTAGTQGQIPKFVASLRESNPIKSINGGCVVVKDLVSNDGNMELQEEN